jgi:hypothetical protein
MPIFGGPRLRPSSCFVDGARAHGMIVIVRSGAVETYFNTTDLNYFDRVRRGEELLKG